MWTGATWPGSPGLFHSAKWRSEPNKKPLQKCVLKGFSLMCGVSGGQMLCNDIFRSPSHSLRRGSFQRGHGRVLTARPIQFDQPRYGGEEVSSPRHEQHNSVKDPVELHNQPPFAGFQGSDIYYRQVSEIIQHLADVSVGFRACLCQGYPAILGPKFMIKLYNGL